MLDKTATTEIRAKLPVTIGELKALIALAEKSAVGKLDVNIFIDEGEDYEEFQLVFSYEVALEAQDGSTKDWAYRIRNHYGV